MIRPRPRAALFSATALLVLLVAVTSCSKEVPPPIQVRETDVIVQNQTQADWTGIQVWVNDHFRGLAPSLVSGQQLVVPLDGLIGPFGQRYDRHRYPVSGVLVTAKSSDGHDVRVTWGKVNRR